MEVTLSFELTGLNIHASKTKISSLNRDEKILAVPLWFPTKGGALIGRQPSSCSDNEEQLRLAYSSFSLQL